MLAWLEEHATTIAWTTAVSVVLLVGSLVAMVWVVASLPQDHFVKGEHPTSRHPVLHALKNVLGACLVLAGVAMIFLPGQGILGILVGIMLLDFPGKWKLQRRIVRRPRVLRTLNWIRAKFGKPPFASPAPATA